MEYEEDPEGNDEDIDEEVYMTQNNESQGHDLLEEGGDTSDEEDGDSYE
jgi:hypothetical protein